MKGVLKIKEPFVNTYQHHGFQTSILLSHIDCLDWLYSKYIQVYYNKKLIRMDYTESYLFKDENAFASAYYRIPYNYCMNNILIPFIKQFINEGNYIIGNWNEYFLSEKPSYQRLNFIHNYLIYGYDEEKEALLSVGYTKDGHWNYFSVPYQKYMDAVLYEENSAVYMEFLSINKYFNPSFDTEIMKEQLNEYLYSKDVVWGQEIYQGGLKACFEYLDYINQVISNGGKMRLESTYLLREHKKIMLERLQYLKSRNIVGLSSGLIEDYNEVLFYFKKLFNMVVKYTISGKKSLGETIYELGNKGFDKEEKILKIAYREMG